MFSTANTYTLTLPSSEQIVFGTDKSDADWVGLVGANGVTSSVDLRESRTSITRADGELIGSSFWGSRSIVCDIFLPQTDAQERSDALRKLQKVTTLLRDEGILSWTETDTAGTEMQVPVRLQSFPTINHTSGPTKGYQIALTATQPHLETAGSQSAITNGNAATSLTAANGGDWVAYPYIKLTGPFTVATVQNTTTGETLSFPSVSIGAGDYLEIFCSPNERQVLKNGSTNAFASLATTSDFISLEPGNNTITFNGSNGASALTAGSTAKITVQWRGAWM